MGLLLALDPFDEAFHPADGITVSENINDNLHGFPRPDSVLNLTMVNKTNWLRSPTHFKGVNNAFMLNKP